MPHCGASPQSMYSTQGDCAHVKGWPRLTQGNEGLVAKLREGLVAKLRMGWEPLGSHPIRHVVCSRISQLWPFNSACLPTLSSVASCLSALPFTLFRSAYLRPTPLRRIRFIRRSSRIPFRFIRQTFCPLPRPVSRLAIDPTFIGSCPLISRTSTSRSPAAPVIHRNGTRTL